MSGPKLSEAELERIRQAELERQRQEHLRRLKEAQGVYREALQAIQGQRNRILNWLKSDAFHALERQQPAVAAALRGELETKAEQLTPVPVSDLQSVEAYQQSAAQSKQHCDRLFQEMLGQIRREEQRYAVVDRQRQKSAAAARLETMLLRLRPEEPVTAIVEHFTFDGALQQLREQLAALAAHLGRWAGSDDRQLAAFARKSSRELTAYARAQDLERQTGQVKLRVEAILNTHQEHLYRLRERAKLYQDYCALAAVLGEPIQPEGGFAEEALLRQTVQRMRDRYQKKDEMNYIADQINQVMIDLGYRFVTSTALRRQDGSEYDYSLYQADEEAGISIYTDESGAVMMQLTRFGEGAVTREDEEENYQRQLDFCAAHPDIVEALAQKGVFLKQKNYAPPAKKYIVKQKIQQAGTRTVLDRRKRRRAKQKVRSL